MYHLSHLILDPSCLYLTLMSYPQLFDIAFVRITQILNYNEYIFPQGPGRNGSSSVGLCTSRFAGTAVD